MLLLPVGLGFARLHFDVEVLNLLPDESPVVRGLKLYQQNFSNARELILTIQSPEPQRAEAAARILAQTLRAASNLVASVTWQPGWMEHPEQAGELIAYLWLNQPPEIFGELTNRLTGTNLSATLAEAQEQLATSMSPMDMARRGYDPFNLTKLPESLTAGFASFGEGQEMFASSDGTFRMAFVEAKPDLTTYRACSAWLDAIRASVESCRSRGEIPRDVVIGYTGRPAFVSEIAGGMEHDMTYSIVLTSIIIAILFWLAHRRLAPMFWLLILLALILAGTLGLGGLLFGTLNVVSLGFAAILLGLAVDYGVVHYQEAMASPEAIVPEIRRAIGPSIFWAAVTTISAFLVLNLGGLPGLAQLGSLVALGVVLSALVMLFGFLPPLFHGRLKRRQELMAAGQWPPPPGSQNPESLDGNRERGRLPLPARNERGEGWGEGHQSVAGRSVAQAGRTSSPQPSPPSEGGEGEWGAALPEWPGHSLPPSPLSVVKMKTAFGITALVILAAGAILVSGMPPMDRTANALRPQNSQAYGALDEIKTRLVQNREPLWILTDGRDETEIRRRLEQATPILERAVSDQSIERFIVPTALWPHTGFQSANRPAAARLLEQRNTLRRAALAQGFTTNSLVMAETMLQTWQAFLTTTNVFWPTNENSRWVLGKMVARPNGEFLAVGFVFPGTNAPVGPASAAGWAQQVSREGFLVSGWDLLGPSILDRVRQNLWLVLTPMILLVLLSLWLAFRRMTEILLSLSVLLLSGICLLALMRVAGWSCDLINLGLRQLGSAHACSFAGNSWNLLNLMALPLMLGSGVDYSIFMQLALRRHDGDLAAAHRSVGRALLLCGGTAVAGFGSLSFSTNAGMASLGQVCAIGIGCNMLISVWLLPHWWKAAAKKALVAQIKVNR